MSLNQQLKDVMARLIERSGPFVLDRKLNFRPAKKSCSECASPKHSTRQHNKVMNMNKYDKLVNDILVPQL